MDGIQKRPLLISHRGAHREVPENSCRGFELALEYGVDGIETDVQLSSDGVPMLYHDVTTYRVTGRRKRFSSYTCEQLQDLDLGEDGACIGIPTLAETLDLFVGRALLFIEIKSTKHDRLAGRSQALTEKVVAEISSLKTSLQETIRILSFDPDVLARTHQLAPGLKCVLNANGPDEWYVSSGDLIDKKVSMDFLNAVNLERKSLSPDMVKWAHDRGMEAFTYCCNTRPKVERVLAMGVDGIMSDKPGWLVGLVRG
ncbi:MAG: glycerophosphodiester phosphodiesterase [Desulfobacterales bacterium]|nr:glycerophosphodiester phosphodiesterase [Desulfobacterales bacterium]